MQKQLVSRLMAILALSLPLLLASPALAAGPSDACAAHAERILTKYQDLPPTYAALATLPTDDARIVFGELPATTRAQVWIDRIDGYVATHPQLTDAQMALLRDAQVILAANPYALDNDTALWNEIHGASLEKLTLRARTLFAADEVQTIFARLDEPSTVTDRPVLAGADRPTLSKSSDIDATALPQCVCSRESDWCDDGYNCERANCAEVPDECGTFWTYNCDGQCFELDATTPDPVEP